MTVSPLRSSAKSNYDPALNMIAALVHSGTYDPERHGIPDAAFRSQSILHAWCKRHAISNRGEAPPAGIIEKKFAVLLPDDIPLGLAVSEIVEEYNDHQMRANLSHQIKLVNEQQYAQAAEIASNCHAQLLLGPGEALHYDHFSPQEEFDVAETYTVPAPEHTEGRTKGVRSGELWLVAARLGEGKTWRLVEHALTAIGSGYDVLFFTLEMPGRAMSSRMRHLENHGTYAKVGQAMRKHEHMPKMHFIDPRNLKGPLSPAVLQSRLTRIERPTLVVIDYVGLMAASSGKRSIEDWRVAAEISNSLKEIATRCDVPIVAAVQLNRTAANGGTPDTSQLSQTDALGQDADCIVAMRGHHTSEYTTNSLIKYRHGPSGMTWHTDFHPESGRFGEIGVDEVERRRSDADEARTPAL